MQEWVALHWSHHNPGRLMLLLGIWSLPRSNLQSSWSLTMYFYFFSLPWFSSTVGESGWRFAFFLSFGACSVFIAHPMHFTDSLRFQLLSVPVPCYLPDAVIISVCSRAWVSRTQEVTPQARSCTAVIITSLFFFFFCNTFWPALVNLMSCKSVRQREENTCCICYLSHRPSPNTSTSEKAAGVCVTAW